MTKTQRIAMLARQMADELTTIADVMPLPDEWRERLQALCSDYEKTINRPMGATPKIDRARVAELLDEGYTVQEIADDLGCSWTSAKYNVRKVQNGAV